MRIPAWRLALTGTAIVILGLAGIGLANAAGSKQSQAPSNQPPAGSSTSAEAAALDAAIDAAPDAAPDGGRPSGDGAPGRGRWFLRHIVHAVVTVQGADGDLYTIQLDRGKVTAVDADSVTLSEAGGASVTVALKSDTKVREGRQRATLESLTVGDDVFVQSRIDGSTLAKWIFIVPAS